MFHLFHGGAGETGSAYAHGLFCLFFQDVQDVLCFHDLPHDAQLVACHSFGKVQAKQLQVSEAFAFSLTGAPCDTITLEADTAGGNLISELLGGVLNSPADRHKSRYRSSKKGGTSRKGKGVQATLALCK